MEQSLKELLAKKASIFSQIEAVKTKAVGLNSELEAVEADIAAAIAEPVKSVRQATGKDTGTVDVLVQGVMVKHRVSKSVTWDQEKLAGIRKRIEDGKDDPNKYMDSTTKYKVTEKAFKAMVPEVKAIFAGARSVKPGKPTVTFDENWR